LRRFYPPDFETDQNGKQNAWESVVLIPFIDEDLMVSALAQVTREGGKEGGRGKAVLIPRLEISGHHPIACCDHVVASSSDVFTTAVFVSLYFCDDIPCAFHIAMFTAAVMRS